VPAPRTSVLAKIIDANEILTKSVTATLSNGELAVRVGRGGLLFDEEGGVAQLIITPKGVVAVSARGTRVELHSLDAVERPAARGVSQCNAASLSGT
jgi:hypothetical protein